MLCNKIFFKCNVITYKAVKRIKFVKFNYLRENMLHDVRKHNYITFKTSSWTKKSFTCLKISLCPHLSECDSLFGKKVELVLMNHGKL